MPYIPSSDRQKFAPALDMLHDAVTAHGLSNGELNYLMTTLALLYIERHGMSYNTGSDVIKAFECAKIEFYRREIAPYEDSKIVANGDVFP